MVALRAVRYAIKHPYLLSIKEAERDAIEAVFVQGLNITDSASALGVTRATLYNKMKEYGIERDGTSTKVDDEQAGSEICNVHQRRKAC